MAGNYYVSINILFSVEIAHACKQIGIKMNLVY